MTRVRTPTSPRRLGLLDGPAGDHAADPVLLAHGRLDGRTRRDAVVDAWREMIAPTLADIVG